MPSSVLHPVRSPPCDVIIAGAGNLGAIILDCLDGDDRWNPIGFLDEGQPGATRFGLHVYGPQDYHPRPGTKAIIAVADPAARRLFVEALGPLGLDWATFIDRRSHVSRLAELGVGSVVLPFATVGPLARIGSFGHIGPFAAVGGTAALGAFVSLLPRASAGRCSVGDGCQLGFNSACLDGVVVGEGTVLAPYTWVRKNVPAGAFVTGNPARVRKRAAPQKHRSEPQLGSAIQA